MGRRNGLLDTDPGAPIGGQRHQDSYESSWNCGAIRSQRLTWAVGDRAHGHCLSVRSHGVAPVGSRNGDPLFNPQSQRARGDFDPQRRGVLAHPASRTRPEFPDASDGKVVSYCHASDAICQGFISFRPFGVSTTAGHSNYDTVGDAASAKPYTAQAASYFANRAGYSSGASDSPTAVITPIQPVHTGQTFEVSGAESSAPDQASLTYAWDLTNSGAFGPPSSSPSTTAAFNTSGTYTIRLKVITSSGSSNIASIAVIVNDPNPGNLQAPGPLTTQLSTGGTTYTVSWTAPSTGPAPQGYEVFSSDGCPLADIANGGPGAVAIPAAGMPAEVEVESVDYDGEGGTATAQETAPPDVVGSLGSPVSLSLQSNQMVQLSFDVPSGEAFQVQNALYSPSTGSSTTPVYFALLDPSANVIRKGSVPGSADYINFSPVIAPAEGVYTLGFYLGEENSQPASGTVNLTVSGSTLVAPVSVDGSAASLALPSTGSANWMAFPFSGKAGQTVYVNGELANLSLAQAATFVLYDPSGNQVASQYLNGGILTPVIDPTTLATSGTYILYVAPPSEYTTGTATVQVLGSFLTGTANPNGSAVSMTIPSGSPMKRAQITIPAQAGEMIYVNSSYTLPNAGLSWKLTDPSGSVLGQQADYGGGTSWNNLVPAFTAQATGNYLLQITPGGSGTLSVQAFGFSGTFATAAATFDGPPVSVNASAGQWAKITYTIANPKGGSYSLAGNLAVGTNIAIFNSSGTRVDDTLIKEANSAPTWDAPPNGTYTAVISPPPGAATTITVQVYDGLIPPPSGQNLSVPPGDRRPVA